MNKKEQQKFNSEVAMLLDNMVSYLYKQDWSIVNRQGPLDDMLKQVARIKGMLQP